MKILIAYYSKTGKTKEIAQRIAYGLEEGNEVKLRRIKMKNEKNLLGTYLLDAKKAIREEKPEIEVAGYDHKGYDLILLGTPVWANNPAPAINTYVDKCDFAGKDVIFFVTMGMTGGERVIKILTDKLKTKKGKVIDSIVIKSGFFHKKKMLQEAEEFAKKLSSTLSA
jgi:flavodoxin